MASNLTNQVRDISAVATAIARGDMTRKISVEVRGELLDLKNVINTMVDTLSSLADEVTRVARDVGVEGKLGGQAAVRGVAGTWKELTDNVNQMASNLTNQVRDIADVTTAVANGDLSRKITVEVRGELLELKNTINTMVDQLSSFADEVTRVAREVGTEGRLGGQAKVKGVSVTWKDLTDNVNAMADNLTDQVRNIADVTTAVATGDLSNKITVVVRGRGHPRCPRGGNRRAARRPGESQGRQRHVEGPDGQRQHAGRQPHQPGAQHRRRDDRGREGRAFEQDHRRRARRDPRAQEH